jgi:hypothetical protein
LTKSNKKSSNKDWGHTVINPDYWADRMEEREADMVDEMRRLRAQLHKWRSTAEQLHDALQVQCALHRVPVTTEPYFTQHAKDAIANYQKAATGE